MPTTWRLPRRPRRRRRRRSTTGEPGDCARGAELAAGRADAPPGRLARAPPAGRAWLVTRGAQAVRRRPAAVGADGRRRCGVSAACSRSSIPIAGAAWWTCRGAMRRRSPRACSRPATADDGEDQIAWRGGQRLACAAAPRRPLRPARRSRFRADATYLVTGGFGGLGLVVAPLDGATGRPAPRPARPPPDPAATGGARHRGARRPRSRAAGRRRRRRGAGGRCSHDLARQAPPLRGIVHAAADLSAAPIAELDAAQVARRCCGPRSTVRCVLERLAQSRPRLPGAVLVDDGAARRLGPGALRGGQRLPRRVARHARDAQGRRVLSVNWGTWDAMRLASARTSSELPRRPACEPMADADALEALGRLLGADAANGRGGRGSTGSAQAAARGASRAAVAEAPGRGCARRRWPPRRRAGVAAAGRRRVGLAQRLAAAPASAAPRPAGRLRRAQEVATVLGLRTADAGRPGDRPVRPRHGLADGGRTEAPARAGRRTPLPSTLTFNYPNVGALAGFLENRALPGGPGSGAVRRRDGGRLPLPAAPGRGRGQHRADSMR